MRGLRNAKGRSSRLVTGLVHPSKYTGRGLVAKCTWSGLLNAKGRSRQLFLGSMPLSESTGLIAIPCSQSRTGVSAAKISSCLLVAKFTKCLVVGSILGTVVAKSAAEVLRGLLELQHGVGHGGRAWSVYRTVLMRSESFSLL